MLGMRGCPFCGRKEHQFDGDDEGKRWVMCSNCGARGPTFTLQGDGPMADVVVTQSWNTRVLEQCDHCHEMALAGPVLEHELKRVPGFHEAMQTVTWKRWVCLNCWVNHVERQP